MANLTALMIGIAIASGSPVDADIQTAATRNIDFDAVVLQMSHSCAAPVVCAPTNDCGPTGCNPCTTSCCDPCSSCDSCCVDGYCCGSYCYGNWCGSCWGCPRHCWSKEIEWTTSDLYQHHWYFPEKHGYYSFRPYNWTHFEWARSAFPHIDQKAPFSNRFLTDVQAEFVKTNGHGPLAANSDQARDLRDHLPNVEDILNNK
ncbi:MAG: hypothetical protein ACYTGL_10165 [Planctomycetota bacterium]